MNTSKYILSVLLMILPLLAIAQFEGTIEMSSTSSETNEQATMEWSLKSGKHHMSISSKSDAQNMEYNLLINEFRKEVWFLTDHGSNKAAYAVPYNNLNQNEFDLPLNSKVEIIGETSKIAGFDCKQLKIISNTNVVECWISEETGISHSDFPSFMSNSDLIGVLKMNGMNGVPLKWEVKNIAGEVLLSQTFNKITPKSIPDSQFEVPSDYTKNGTSK